MHNAAIRALNIDYIYVPFHVLPDNLGQAVQGIRAMEIAGVNVTIPHKEQVIEHLDEISEYSTRIRSVNTITNVDGHLRGDTTDGPGFVRSAVAAWGKLDGCRTLILGAGGSAKAVGFALAEIGCKIVIANRTRERAVELAEGLRQVFKAGTFGVVDLDGQALSEEIPNIDLVVNTTSVGMHPDVDGIPMPPDLLHPHLLVYDLVYNPARTRLVTEAERRGANAITGLKMLVYQGALSFEMWTGIEAPVAVMEEAALEILSSQC
jgi:shikimate dehydrogenase